MIRSAISLHRLDYKTESAGILIPVIEELVKSCELTCGFYIAGDVNAKILLYGNLP